SYYYWRNNPRSTREQQQKELSDHIREANEVSKGRYGSPRIAAELQARGISVLRPRVARAMKKMGLKSIVRKKYRVQTTDSKHQYQVSKNHLNRDFSAERIAQKWVSDLTYIKTGEGWVYLTVILDLADRKVV